MRKPIIAKKVRVFFTPQARGWQRLQEIYARDPEEGDKRSRARRCVYRNALLAVLAQIQFQPKARNGLFQSLLAHAEHTRSFDGLETPFLTLLHCAYLDRDRHLFDHALAVWDKYSGKPKVPGAGPARFYDVEKRTATFFTAAAVKSVRAGGEHRGVLAWGPELAAHLSGLGVFVVEGAFRPAGTPQPIRFLSPVPPGPMQTRANKMSERDKAQWHVWGAEFIIAGVIAEEIPGLQAAGVVLIVEGLIVESVPDIVEIFSDPDPAPSGDPGGTSSVDIDTGGSGEGDGGVEAGDGVLVANDGGEGDEGDEGIGEVGGLDGEDDGGGEGGEGGGSCFSADTPVLMGDGGWKPIGSPLSMSVMGIARTPASAASWKSSRSFSTYLDRHLVSASSFFKSPESHPVRATCVTTVPRIW